MKKRIQEELWLWALSARGTLRLFRTRRLVETLEWMDEQLVTRGR